MLSMLSTRRRGVSTLDGAGLGGVKGVHAHRKVHFRVVRTLTAPR